MKPANELIAIFLLSAAILIPASAFSADDLGVNITPEIASVEVTHSGKKTTVMRNQNEKNTVNANFALTSRKIGRAHV